MRASEGPALWGSELQGPSGMWQPACPLPLCDLAGAAPLAPDHQDTPQHEECHQGEGSHVPPSLSHLSPKPCPMACVQNRTGELRLVREHVLLPQAQWSSWAPLFLTPHTQSIYRSHGLRLHPASPIGSHHTFLAKAPLCLTWTFPPLLSLSHRQGSTQPTEQNDLLSLSLLKI